MLHCVTKVLVSLSVTPADCHSLTWTPKFGRERHIVEVNAEIVLE